MTLKPITVVVTAACLMYISPAKIESVLRDMWALTTFALVLLELHETVPENPDVVNCLVNVCHPAVRLTAELLVNATFVPFKSSRPA